ncbi:uncharacterized protein LOC133531976 [Cydia pomonella]|uniref:uncharacterized protein LOC133531976 n=1 Tax=Cydia pomonella TaxID=82600 RepID=UPI002ADE5300|nr:uncharacterized protein LOC133531976 [Cydia pomonella]XP_061726418.1 uncharacterized protein LOC133531976 [Cydia pomonella]
MFRTEAANLTVLTVAPTTTTTTMLTTLTVKLRADQGSMEPTEFYQSPYYIDDSECKASCTTCTDNEGYRVYCLNGTTTPAPNDLTLVIITYFKIYLKWKNSLSRARLELATLDHYFMICKLR